MPAHPNYVKVNGKFVKWENSPQGKAEEQKQWESGQANRNAKHNEDFRQTVMAKKYSVRKSRKNRKASRKASRKNRKASRKNRK
jgi:hypothetical protein